jgi:hypothetical protein
MEYAVTTPRKAPARTNLLIYLQVFGGAAEPAIQYDNQSENRKTPPFAYFLYTVWPDRRHGAKSTDPVLTNPQLHEYQTAFPIQASFYEGTSFA